MLVHMTLKGITGCVLFKIEIMEVVIPVKLIEIFVQSISHEGCNQCPNTRNQYNDYCVPKCPAETPLRGSDNSCYPCNTDTRVPVNNMTDACYECPNERKLDGNYCVLK